MLSNFRPMLDELVRRGTITEEEANNYDQITKGRTDEEAYILARDFILENYYAETYKDIHGKLRVRSN